MATFGKLDFAVALSPSTAFPLDARYTFDTLAAAKQAAAGAVEVGSSEGTYYYSQLVGVMNEGKAELYIIGQDKKLHFIGNKIFASESAAQAYAQGEDSEAGQICVVTSAEGADVFVVDANKQLSKLSGGGAGASLVVSTHTDLTTTVPEDLEVGQTAFVTDEGKSYILTELGEDPPTSYVWVEMTNTDVVWQGTEDPVTFYALTQATYDGLDDSVVDTTIYFTTDTGRIYKGSTDVTGHVITTTSIPEASAAVAGKLYINTSTFETKVTTDNATWIVMSPGYITDGGNWAETGNDGKLATIKAIKQIIQGAIDSLNVGNKIDKVASATENNVPTFAAGGSIQDSGKKIGGETLEAVPNGNTLATEKAVANIISWNQIASQ